MTRAFSDLEGAIESGAIYLRCARAGLGIPRRTELQAHPYASDIAAEAIEACLDRFRTKVLPEGQWDPARGTSLEDFFTSCCLSDLANRWQWYFRRLPRRSISLNIVDNEEILRLPVDEAANPATAIEDRDLLIRTLAPMAEVDQKIFALLADGWSAEEIAQSVGTTRDALYARISRARTAARTRRTL